MNVLGIFVKHPVAGHVKTRLAACLGEEQATRIYAAFSADLVDRFREIGDRRVLCYAPDNANAASYFAELGGCDYELWPQPAGSLGNRMEMFFRHYLCEEVERIVVIGSDSPTLPSDLITHAFELLKTHECVLGPACDGGFYLIGQQGKPRAIFDDIPWSSSQALLQVVGRIEKTGGRLGLLPPWYDVDTIDDLNLLAGHVRALRASGNPVALKRTEPLLQHDKEVIANDRHRKEKGKRE